MNAIKSLKLRISNGRTNKKPSKIIKLLETLKPYKDDFYINVDFDNIHIETLNLPTKKAKKKIDN